MLNDRNFFVYKYPPTNNHISSYIVVSSVVPDCTSLM